MSLNTLQPLSDLLPASDGWRTLRALVPTVRFRQRFILVASPRSGAGLLAELLNAHADIACEEGVLAQKRRALPFYLTARRARAATPYYGVAVTQAQLVVQSPGHPRRVLARLHRQGWKLILLERDNLLRQALSFVIVNHRRSWGHPDPWRHRRGDGPLALDRIRIDPRALLARLEDVEHRRRQTRETLRDLPHLTLSYERDLLGAEAQQAAADKVCDFLGARRMAVASNLVKVGPADLAMLIDNYAELTLALADSPYADMMAAS